MKTLGVYGPAFDEAKETAVASYVANSLPHLSKYFDCTLVSRPNAATPWEFDHVLYHLSASIHTWHAHSALHERPGPAIIHEHNCLQLYYVIWDTLSDSLRDRIMGLFSQELGGSFSDLAEAQAAADGLPNTDRYCVDVGVEVIFMEQVTAAITHSIFIRDLLRERYPQTRTEMVPFMVEPFTLQEALWARKRLHLKPDDFLFGVFGRIGEYKRIEQIVCAWQTWQNRPQTAKLLILGMRQYDVEIPELENLIYIDYIPNEREFDAYLAAVDCGIQLRHPSLGETSGVISKMIANGKRLIVSDTPYTSDYQRLENVVRVRPDKDEIFNLMNAFQETIELPRLPLTYDPRFAPDMCVRRWVDIIVPRDTKAS